MPHFIPSQTVLLVCPLHISLYLGASNSSFRYGDRLYCGHTGGEITYDLIEWTQLVPEFYKGMIDKLTPPNVYCGCQDTTNGGARTTVWEMK